MEPVYVPYILLACKVRVTVGDSGLCCVCVTSFERSVITPLFVVLCFVCLFNSSWRFRMGAEMMYFQPTMGKRNQRLFHTLRVKNFFVVEDLDRS